MPRTVRHDQMTAAVSLSSLSMQIGTLVGPAIGGLLVGTVGVAVGLRRRRRRAGARHPPVRRDARATRRPTSAPRRAWPASSRASATRCGRRDLLGTYLIDMVAMFMAMPIVLFPAFAQDVLRPAEDARACSTPPRASAPCCATLTSGWTAGSTTTGGPSWSPRCAGAARSRSPGWRRTSGSRWCSSSLAGAADMISGIFRGTIWNQTIPDEKRGRLAGIEMLSYSVGPLGGQARSGLVADATSVRASIVSGGVLCVRRRRGDRGLAAGLLALRRPHRRARGARTAGPRRTHRAPDAPDSTRPAPH